MTQIGFLFTHFYLTPNSCSNILYFYIMAEKNISISYLRVIATVFVIAIHASTGFLYRYDADSFDWNYANWINAATRCAVPLFVMISGALLLQKDESIISFYRKRIPKLLYPFIFWTIIYTIYYFYRYTNFSILPSWRIWEIAWHKILYGANAHLWYLYMIMGLYTAIPFLRKMVSQCSARELEVFLVLWFVSLFFMNKSYNLPKFDLTFFSGYIGYLVLGYYLTLRKITWNTWFLLFLYACAVVGIAIGTYYLSEKLQKWDTQLMGYTMPTAALTAVLLFTCVQSFSRNITNIPSWIALVDRYSFGIYLVHILPLNYVPPLISKYVSTVWVIPLATLATLVLSIALIFLLRRIPYGRHVSG